MMYFGNTVDQDQEFRMTDRRKQDLKNNTSNTSIQYFYGWFFGPKRGEWQENDVRKNDR
jgi:hypothetical protein